METVNLQNQFLVEAAEWRLISLFFDCPTGDWFDQVDALGKQVYDKRLKRAAKFARKQASEGMFHSIFGPGGPAPGREVSYRGWVQPGYLLSELASCYNAFSYKPMTAEVPDHVSVETGFVAYLRLKEYLRFGNRRQRKRRHYFQSFEDLHRRSCFKICPEIVEVACGLRG